MQRAFLRAVLGALVVVAVGPVGVAMAEAPTVSSITPSTGSTLGGTTVTIKGTGFVTGATVSIGGNEVPSGEVFVGPETEITATTPAGSAGPAAVVVTDIDGTSEGGPTYTYIAPPTVESITPNEGPTSGGTEVTIKGKDFAADSTVTIGGATATEVKVAVDEEEITAKTPAGTPGAAAVIVSDGGGPSNTNVTFTYIAPPTVSSVAPKEGPEASGTAVTIKGTNLSGASEVKFGSTKAPAPTKDTAGEIEVESPAGSAGTVNVTVTTPGGTSAESSADHFTYIAGPSVESILPSSGPATGASKVTIKGKDFAADSTVTIGGATATEVKVAVDEEEITAKTPAGTPGAAAVIVSDGGGPSNTNVTFTYIAPPTVSSVAPKEGPEASGTAVTIKGTNLSGASEVKFGSTKAPAPTKDTAGEIEVESPAGSAGTVNVTVTTPGGTSAESSADHFTYIAGPSVESILPSSGPATGASKVTIKGKDFAADSTVTIGGATATEVKVAVDEEEITAKTPAGTPGAAAVIVSDGGGPSNTNVTFTYIAPPTVSSVAPKEGPEASGTAVTIKGTNLSGASEVKFGSTKAPAPTKDTAGEIEVESPAGSAGTVNVTVTTPGGTSAESSADHFTYIAGPSVESILPSSGPATGASKVTIKGKDFAADSTVTIGGATATEVKVAVDEEEITAKTPAGTPGAAAVIVSDGGGPSNTNVTFTYIAPPTVSSVAPKEGPEASGTAVTIKGTNLSGASEVKFGSTKAPAPTKDTAGEIEVESPAGSAGTVNVTVTTPGGTSAESSADHFTYIAGPSVESILPSSGPATGASKVTIKGKDFAADSTVTIGGATATEVKVAVDEEEITAKTPAGTPGAAAVIVSDGGGPSNTNVTFTYIAPPTVSSVAPKEGPEASGTAVTIKGTNLSGASEVKFGSTKAPAPTKDTAGEIEVESPAGSAGTVNVTVTTPGGTSAESSADHFTYIAPPTVETITPNRGPALGGTSVKIKGKGFLAGSTVTIGSAASEVKFVSKEEITAKTALTVAGSDEVIVTDIYGTSKGGPKYTYTEPPVVTLSALSPARSNVTRPSFSGTASEETEVEVHVVLEGTGEVAHASTTASGGTWSTKGTALSAALGSGKFTAFATEKSGVGNLEGRSKGSISFEVDTQPPTVTLVGPPSPSNNTTPSFSGEASEETEVEVHVFEGSTELAHASTTATGNTWSTSTLSKTLPTGKHVFTAYATEKSGLGNDEGKSNPPVSFEVDTLRPVVTLVGPPSPSNNTTPSFSGEASEETEVEVHVFEGSTELAHASTTATGNTWSTSTLSKTLPTGKHVFTAYATEKSGLGNEAGKSATVPFEVNTLPPAVTLAEVSKLSNNTKPSFKGTASETKPVTVEIYEGTIAEDKEVSKVTATVSGGDWSSGEAPALPIGKHMFTAVAIEESSLGNSNGESIPITFEVNTLPPAVSLEGLSRSNDTKPSFKGTASEAKPVTVEIYEGVEAKGTPVSKATAPGGGNWSSGEAEALPSGKHVFTAVASEESSLGNGTGVSTPETFEVNTLPPAVTLAEVSKLSNNTKPSFKGTASETKPVTVEIYEGTIAEDKEVSKVTATVSGGDWSSGEAPALPIGKHMFTAVAIEESSLGNSNGESIPITFEVNTLPPAVSLEGLSRSNDTKPSFKGTASEAGPAVTVDIYEGTEAKGSVVASATAAGGRSGTSWLSGAASPALPPGNRTFTAVAVEPSGIGNVEGKSAEVHFEVNTEPPELKLNTVARSNDTTPSFSGTASEPGQAVTVDVYAGTKAEGKVIATATAAGGRSGASWESGDVSPALGEGERIFTAVAVEESGIGNGDGKSNLVTFEVDTRPPAVTISQPKTPSNIRDPGFSGEASENTEVVVHVLNEASKEVAFAKATASGGKWSVPAGSLSKELAEGEHTFTAYATEKSEIKNKEGESAKVTFKVNTEPPVVTLHQPATPSNNTKPSFSGTASENTEVVVHVFEGTTEVAKAKTMASGGTWSTEPLSSALKSGKNTFKAYATEKSGLGNGEGRSKEEPTFEVNTEPPAVTLNEPAAISGETAPEFSGAASEAGEVTVEVFEGANEGVKAEGTSVAKVVGAVSNEKWKTPHLTKALKDGWYAAVAREPSSLKNEPGKSNEVKFEVDTGGPVITIDQPPSPSSNTKPSFEGTASNEPGEVTVHIREGQAEVAQVTASVEKDGKWGPVQLHDPLSSGYHAYRAWATATSKLNGEPGKSALTTTFVIDTDPPVLTLNPPPTLSNDTVPAFSGTTNEAGEVKVAVYKGATVDGERVATVAGAAGVGSWATEKKALSQELKATGGKLGDGEYTAVAEQESGIGNGTGESTPVTFTIDTKPPTVTLNTFATPSSERLPAFSGSASEGEPVTLKIYSGATATGTPIDETTAIVSAGEWYTGKLEESKRLEWGEYTAVATAPSGICDRGTCKEVEKADSAQCEAFEKAHNEEAVKQCEKAEEADLSSRNETGSSQPFTFEVEQIPPGVVTEDAKEVTERTAALYASVDPLGGPIAECNIEVGRTTAYERKIGCGVPLGAVSFTEHATTYVPVFIRIYGLSPTTVYHYRVVARGEGGTGEGEDKTFTTLAEEPFSTPGQHGAGPAPSSSSSGQPKGGVAAFSASQLKPTGKAANIGALLKNGFFKQKLTTSEAGTAVVKWYYLPPGAKLPGASAAKQAKSAAEKGAGKAAKKAPPPVLVASGSVTFHAAGTASVKLRLTGAGRRLLRHSKRIRLTATCAFTPVGGAAVATSGTFQLSR